MKSIVNKSITLFEFLIEKYPDSPRTRIKKLLQSGNVWINGRSVSLHSHLLNPGDEVIIKTPKAKSSANLPFPLLHEDRHVIVIDKPAGKPTSSIDGSISIQQIISEYLKNQSKGKQRAHVVHRLDKEVSGVLMFAKSEEIMDIIKDAWNETEKHYFALVEGTPPYDEDTIKSWLTEDDKQKVHSTQDRSHSKLAITHYKIIKRLKKYTLLDIKTDTGRKNQIRVHLSELGCPIVGDRKYGASKEFIRRIRLHACSLSYPDPVNGKTITVNSPMPEGFLLINPGDEHYK